MYDRQPDGVAGYCIAGDANCLPGGKVCLLINAHCPANGKPQADCPAVRVSLSLWTGGIFSLILGQFGGVVTVKSVFFS